MNFIYRSNTIVSGLGTNAVIKREFADAYFIEIFYPYQYDGGRAGCYEETNPVGRGLFFPTIDNRYEQKDPELFGDYDEFRDQSSDSNISATMEGFSGGCFPLDAILSSTLQCLCNTSCLEILPNYFPGFSRVCVEWEECVWMNERQCRQLQSRTYSRGNGSLMHFLALSLMHRNSEIYHNRFSLLARSKIDKSSFANWPRKYLHQGPSF